MPKINLKKILALDTTKPWFRAEASDPESGEGVDRIYIDGVIGGDWFGRGMDAHDFRVTAEALRAPTLEVHINSPGGSVDEGIAIYSYLASDPRKIVCVVDGMAASIASVILMAADEIKINAAASIMVHRPWAVAAGNEVELRQLSVELGNTSTRLAKLYQARTGQTFRAVEDLMRGEDGADGTLMDADEALRLGFADEIIPAKTGDVEVAALYAALFDAEDAGPEKRKPCEGEENEEEEKPEEVVAETAEPDEVKPEEKPEPSTPSDPAEPTTDPAPASPSEPEPVEAPEPAPAEEPEKKPDEGTAEESSEVEEEEKPEEEEAKAKAAPAPAPRALRPAPEVVATAAVSDWAEAVKVCGSYASARRKYPSLYEEFMEAHR